MTGMDDKQREYNEALKKPPEHQSISAYEMEIGRLQTELGKAYRVVHGFYSKLRKNERPDPAMLAYHSMTLAAAGRFVREGSLDGSNYFEGKPVEIMKQELSK